MAPLQFANHVYSGPFFFFIFFGSELFFLFSCCFSSLPPPRGCFVLFFYTGGFSQFFQSRRPERRYSSIPVPLSNYHVRSTFDKCPGFTQHLPKPTALANPVRISGPRSIYICPAISPVRHTDDTRLSTLLDLSVLAFGLSPYRPHHINLRQTPVRSKGSLLDEMEPQRHQIVVPELDLSSCGPATIVDKINAVPALKTSTGRLPLFPSMNLVVACSPLRSMWAG